MRINFPPNSGVHDKAEGQNFEAAKEDYKEGDNTVEGDFPLADDLRTDDLLLKNQDELRDDGVTDEEWNELQQAKEDERSRLAQIAREQAEFEEFVKKYNLALEEARKREEIELERIRKQLEDEEREEAERKLREAEEMRRREAEREMLEREMENRKRQEELERTERIREKLRQMMPCPAGFNWFKIGGGWRCGGGSHFVSDKQLKRNFMTS